MAIRKNKRDFAMDGAAFVEESQDEKGNLLKDLVGILETGKAAAALENALRETDVEERRLQNSEEEKNENSDRNVERKQCKMERPISADVLWDKRSFERCRRKHLGEFGSPEGGERRGRRPDASPSCCGCSVSRGQPRGPWPPLPCPPGSHRLRSRSLTHCCPHSDTLPPFFPFPFHLPRACKSTCRFSKTTFQNCEKISGAERDFQKVQRSLRLLGFDPSDFGILSGRAETTPKWKPQRRSSTLSTKITRRSVSLDSLRAAVRRAWLDDRLDESHRRLLAQAAYEEWYFTKERELREKREGDRIKQLNTKLKLRDDFQKKKAKSEEEFQKWLSRKAAKRKGGETPLVQKREAPFTRLMDTKEKSERAFLNWKKTKDKEMEKIKTEKRKEEEKEMEREKQKAERKIMAEKAFQQWKMKLEESERKRDMKAEKNKRRKKIEERQKRAEQSQISFKMWKEAKDEQIKQRMKQYRENNRTEREERFAQIEERMYEAEQAFEDWLEQVDLRKVKQCYNISLYQKTIPWIPV